jgi:hypothetical protein
VSDLSRIADLPTPAEIGAPEDREAARATGPEGPCGMLLFGHESAEESLM